MTSFVVWNGHIGAMCPLYHVDLWCLPQKRYSMSIMRDVSALRVNVAHYNGRCLRPRNYGGSVTCVGMRLAVGGGNLIGIARGGINSSNTGKLYWGADPSFVASIVQGWRRGSGTEDNILVPRRGASRRNHREEVMETWDAQGIAMRKGFIRWNILRCSAQAISGTTLFH